MKYRTAVVCTLKAEKGKFQGGDLVDLYYCLDRRGMNIFVEIPPPLKKAKPLLNPLIQRRVGGRDERNVEK